MSNYFDDATAAKTVKSNEKKKYFSTLSPGSNKKYELAFDRSNCGKTRYLSSFLKKKNSNDDGKSLTSFQSILNDEAISFLKKDSKYNFCFGPYKNIFEFKVDDDDKSEKICSEEEDQEVLVEGKFKVICGLKAIGKRSRSITVKSSENIFKEVYPLFNRKKKPKQSFIEFDSIKD